MTRFASLFLILGFAGCIADSSSALDDVDPIDMALSEPEPDMAVTSDGEVDDVDATPPMELDASAPLEPLEQACEKEDRFFGNQRRERAEEIALGFASDDLFICPETQDWYRLNLDEGQQVTIQLAAIPAETDLTCPSWIVTGKWLR